MAGGLIGALLAAAFGGIILVATSHPSSRAARMLFWWSIRFGNGPAESRLTRIFGYGTGLFWLGVAAIVLVYAR